jgi:hypothetical protein
VYRSSPIHELAVFSLRPNDLVEPTENGATPYEPAYPSALTLALLSGSP